MRCTTFFVVPIKASPKCFFCSFRAMHSLGCGPIMSAHAGCLTGLPISCLTDLQSCSQLVFLDDRIFCNIVGPTPACTILSVKVLPFWIHLPQECGTPSAAKQQLIPLPHLFVHVSTLTDTAGLPSGITVSSFLLLPRIEHRYYNTIYPSPRFALLMILVLQTESTIESCHIMLFSTIASVLRRYP